MSPSLFPSLLLTPPSNAPAVRYGGFENFPRDTHLPHHTTSTTQHHKNSQLQQLGLHQLPNPTINPHECLWGSVRPTLSHKLAVASMQAEGNLIVGATPSLRDKLGHVGVFDTQTVSDHWRRNDCVGGGERGVGERDEESSYSSPTHPPDLLLLV